MAGLNRIFAILFFLYSYSGSLQAQTANITYTMDPPNGCAPVQVCFKGTATGVGTPTSFIWNIPANPNNDTPCKVYIIPGTYVVTLKVVGTQGTTQTASATIVVHDYPAIQFTGSPLTGCPPLTVNFNSNGTNPNGSPATYTWYTAGANPLVPNGTPTFSAKYPSWGSYDVTLSVTNSFGCTRSLTKTNYVQPNTPPSGFIQASQTKPCSAPTDSITFTGSAVGVAPPYTYNWKFSDGFQASGPTIKHSFAGPKGQCYDVRMIVTDNNGCSDTTEIKDLICIPNIQANFTASPASACVGTEITFTSTGTPAPDNIAWDFQFPSGFVNGPATTTHTYYTAGTYTVAMIHTSQGCSDTEYKQVTIYPQPTLNYTFTPAEPCPAPQTLTFTGTGASTYTWNFGDGPGTVTGNPKSHTYNTCGLYSSSVIGTDSHGCKDTLDKLNDVAIFCGELNINPVRERGCRPLKDTFYASLAGILYVPFYIYSNYPYPIVSYEWNFGDNTPLSSDSIPIHTFDTCGLVTVKLKVVTSNGCIFYATKDIEVGEKPDGGFYATPLRVCPDDTVHFIDTTHFPCTQTGIKRYYWDFGEGGFSTQQNPYYIYDDDTGKFCVSMIVSYYGCADTVAYCPLITVDPPVAKFVFSYNCDERLKVNFTNHSFGFTSFYWQFPSPIGIVNTLNPIVTFPAYGTYTVKLYTFNSVSGCMDTFKSVVDLTKPEPVLTATDTTICPNDNVRFNGVFINPAFAANSYRWYVNDTLRSVDSVLNYTHHFTKRGYYKLMLAMKDGMGCWDTTTKPNWVLVSKPDVSFVGNPTTGCAPLTVSFTDQSVPVPAPAGPLPGAPIVTRYWQFGTPGGTITTPAATTSYTYMADGIYDVKLIVTDNSGCKDSLTKTGYIQAHRPKAAFLANDTTTCIGVPVIFINTSTSGVSFKWYFGDGDTSVAAAPTHAYKATGAYTVMLVATDIYGCNDTLTKPGYITLTRPHAAFTMDDSVAVCPPLKVTFDNLSTGHTSMTWMFGNGSVVNTMTKFPFNWYYLPGYDTVYAIAIDANGCKDTATGHVNILGYNGAFSYTPLTGCNPLEVTFTINVQNIPSIVWDFGDGHTYTGSSSVVKHTYTIPGAYIPKIIMSSSPNCSAGSVGLDTIKVDDVEAKISHSPACEGYFVKFTDSSYSYFTKVIDWAWSFNNGPVTSTFSTTSHYYGSAGTYPVKLIVTNANGCRDTTDTVVVIHELPVISAGADTIICLQDAASLLATGGISYLWSPPATLSCTDCPNPKANPVVKTEYTVIGTDINGCSDTDQVVVNIKLKVTSVVADGGEICADESIVLQASGANAYEWSPADLLDNSRSATPVASPHYTTKFRVVAFEGSCIPDTDYVDVIVHPKPIVHASGGITIIAGNDAPLQADGNDIHTFLWKPAETLNCTDCPNPIAKPSRTTTYVIIASTEFGCQDSDKVTVKVLCDQSQLFIPNTFTPNGDGQNDMFYPRGVGFDRLRSFRIYDRWGELLYERTAFPLNDRTSGWDGTYKGKVLPPDVYVYAVEADCEDGEVIRWKGDITLIR